MSKVRADMGPDAIVTRPDDVPVAGLKGQTDLKALTLLRDRQLAKATVREEQAVKNKEALKRPEVVGEARKILESGVEVSGAEAVRLRRIVKALDAAIAAMGGGKE